VKAKTLIVLSTLLCAGAAPPVTDEAKKELARLQGTWEMAALEVNGVEVPQKELQGTILTIRGDRYIVRVKKTTHETTFKLHPGTEPKGIDMYFPDGPNLPKLSKGAYDLDGDTFRLCRHQAPGEERPRQIGSWPGTNLFVVTWKRIR
jgi:uncharacterized protein (TIGR03067 family)